MDPQLFEAMAESIIAGEAEDAARLAGEALKGGTAPLEAINQGFIPGLEAVGEGFSRGEMFLPDLVLAGEAMKAALAVLEPRLHEMGTERPTPGTIVIGTVEGDIHDIGKTLVATMLSASGFRVYDLGVDVPVREFVEKARQVDADAVGVSALLTTTMVKQRQVIAALEEAGLRPWVKVMVGGAPVTEDWAREIGADGYSQDAIGAVALAKELIATREA